MPEENQSIKSFTDLWVYRNSYAASLEVFREVIPRLPREEKFDLADQMSRACKAVPRLIAEGYAKRHQKAGFQKYLDDANAESNEMIVCLNHCKDLYPQMIDVEICVRLIDVYDKTSRGVFNLAAIWVNFTRQRRKNVPSSSV
jgi:four helix bundle protein